MLKNEKGSAMIQVAIMFPILLALTFGMINFMLLTRDATIMESASRSAARQYGTSKSIDSAINKGREDLRLGLVKGASVSIENNKVAVRKPVNAKIPFIGNIRLDIKKETVFLTERVFYYGKPPHLQGSPIDGFSGYTGNPYKP